MRFTTKIERKLSIFALCLTTFASFHPIDAYGSGRDVLLDCTDNDRLDRKYSQKEYEDALNEVQADLAQYGNCVGLIRKAQLEKSSRGNQNQRQQSTTQKTGPATPNNAQALTASLPPAAKKEVQKLQEASATPPAAEVGGQNVSPSLRAKSPKLGKFAELPAPAIGIIGLLGVGLAGRGFKTAARALNKLRG